MIKIITQYLKSIDFKLPASPKFFLLEKHSTPDIEVDVAIDAKKINRKDQDSENSEDELLEITLSINVTAQISFENKKETEELFSLKTSYTGLFMIKAEDKKDLNSIVSIYCPTILFPFVRRIVATTTADAGLPPLMLDPIDFSKVEKKQQAD